jgi:hypothetical protein
VTAGDLLLLGSIACSIAFYVFSAAVYVLRRPPVPPVLPAMSDVGPQNPAVANLLANGGRVTPDAVPATLFDLAARKVVQIEETEAHHYQVRIASSAGTNLAAYESRVMQLLRSRASKGVVPAGALTLGSANEAKGWLRGFSGDVTSEARSQNLCAPRWPRPVLSALGVITGGALLFFVLNVESENERTFMWVIAGALAFSTVWVSGTIFRETSQLVTSSGLQMQSRWLALRKYLHDDELFPTLPPTAVAVRDRYIAYGAALGVAAGAVRAIPMGAESDRRAWSSVGGRWRQVTVSYPTVWPPAYGRSPRSAMWLGLRVAAISGALLFGLWQAVPRLLDGASDSDARNILGGELIVTAILLVAVGVGLYLIAAGVVSLFGARTVVGDAVRIRQYGGDPPANYLAVDTGASDRVRAWKVSGAIYDRLTEYESVTVVVTPLLGYVRSVREGAVKKAAAPAAVEA